MVSTPPPRPINWQRLRREEAERIIHERAQISDNINWTEHALERSQERDITSQEIYRILRDGQVLQEPTLNDHGDWEAVIQRRVRGNRDAGAVTIIIEKNNELTLKTVMWMDQ